MDDLPGALGKTLHQMKTLTDDSCFNALHAADAINNPANELYCRKANGKSPRLLLIWTKVLNITARSSCEILHMILREVTRHDQNNRKEDEAFKG